MREHTQNCGHVREQTQFSGHVHEHNFTQYLSVLSLQLIGNNNRQTSLCIYRWLLDGNVYIHIRPNIRLEYQNENFSSSNYVNVCK